VSKIKDNEAPAAKVLGIGAVLTNDGGVVVAHAFDFERQGYGGFKLWEAQRLRVKRSVVRQFIEHYTYGDMPAAIDEYAGEQIVSNLRNKGKLRLTFFAIGHDLSDQELN
jgi:hypothetical protein